MVRWRGVRCDSVRLVARDVEPVDDDALHRLSHVAMAGHARATGDRLLTTALRTRCGHHWHVRGGHACSVPDSSPQAL